MISSALNPSRARNSIAIDSTTILAQVGSAVFIGLRLHVVQPQVRYTFSFLIPSSSTMSPQLTFGSFGSFGDFVTLIQIIRELSVLIRDAVMMRRDIQRFVTFLDAYSTTMSCIEDILRSGPSHILPPKVLQCIRNAVREASRLIRDFFAYIPHLAICH